jgi:UPF0755 protein
MDFKAYLRNRKNRRNVAVLVAATVVVLLALYIQVQLSPVGTTATKKSVDVTVAAGDSTRTIVDKLAQAGAIRNASLFYYYVRLTGHGADFRAGTYTLSLDATRSDIVRVLTGKSIGAIKTMKFTIPEGYTAKQIAERLASKGYVNKAEFMELLQQPGAFDSTALETLPTDSKQLVRLEGYLFPDTYVLPIDSTEKEIVQTMVGEFDAKLGELPAGWKQQMAKRKLTLHEVLTVASLIEREVVVDKERPIVASVIYNRLHIGQPLQIDATVQYLLPEQKARLMYSDLKVDSPYNTYKVKGLPPGPIANPSLASIKAALYPESTKYYYYVTKKDGTSSHLFATTYAEHLNNIAKSKQ